MISYIKLLLMENNELLVLLESVDMGKAGYIKNANYFIKLAENNGFIQLENNTTRSNTTDSVYFLIKSPNGIIFQCRSSDHDKKSHINENDIDTYITKSYFDEEYCKEIFNQILQKDKSLPSIFKSFIPRLNINFIKQYILYSISEKLTPIQMANFCHKNHIVIKNDNVINYFWFKKKLKEKVIQFLQAFPEYQKYKDKIGILSWNEEDNYLERW